MEKLFTETCSCVLNSRRNHNTFASGKGYIGKPVIYAKNTDKSLDECRRITDKYRRMWTSVDVSLDECRRIKKLFFDSRRSGKWSYFVVVACNQSHVNCIQSDIGMRIFNFVVLFVITAPHKVPIRHISKTHLPVVSLNGSELELN